MSVDGSQYPINLVLAGRPVLVVGGESVAAAKVAGVIDAAPVTVERRMYASREAADYRLVVPATDDPDFVRSALNDSVTVAE